jgi:hypothetical protein
LFCSGAKLVVASLDMLELASLEMQALKQKQQQILGLLLLLFQHAAYCRLRVVICSDALIIIKFFLREILQLVRIKAQIAVLFGDSAAFPASL